MAFDPGLYEDDPFFGDPLDEDGPSADEEEALRLTRNDIAAKAGYPSWEAYTAAIGSLKALQQQQLALQIKSLQDQIARGGAVSPTVSAQLAQSQQQFEARAAQDRQEREVAVAEQQRQFNEKLAFEKAQFDQRAVADAAEREQKQRQFEATQGLGREQLDVQRGNILLGLGSRPETLYRYLYALRGQQAPQQLGGTTTALPGYPGVPATPQAPPPTSAAPPPQAVSSPVAAGGAAPLAPAPPGYISQPGMLVPQPTPTYASGFDQIALTNRLNAATPGVAPPLPGQTQAQAASTPGVFNPATLDLAPGVTFNAARSGGLPPVAPGGLGMRQGIDWASGTGAMIRGAPGSAQELWATSSELRSNTAAPDILAEYRRRRAAETEERAEGGPISEPVVGVGLHSGQTYVFGEEGPEHVVPEGKTLAEVKGKSGKGRRRRTTNSYGSGGTIGYQTDYDPRVFNPPNLADIVSRGYNTPGVPLLPQVGVLTGQGQSLIPSAQSFFQSLPSERAAYSGFLQDEAGVVPEDVTDLMRRLAPKATNIRTPRFAA